MIIRLAKRDAFRNLLMVTSSGGGEGNITCLNRAVILAQEHNHTVLLVIKNRMK